MPRHNRHRSVIYKPLKNPSREPVPSFHIQWIFGCCKMLVVCTEAIPGEMLDGRNQAVFLQSPQIRTCYFFNLLGIITRTSC